MKLLSLFTTSNNTFDGEGQGEKTVLVIRRHPFFIIIKVIVFVFLAVLPAAVYICFSSEIAGRGFSRLALLFLVFWYIILWLGLFYSLAMYALDVWIVTDRRIIDSKQRGFWNRTVSELHINRVQDTSVETKGLIQTIFKFGDLQVQTAGADEKFRFLQIPHPERVKDQIMKMVSTNLHPRL